MNKRHLNKKSNGLNTVARNLDDEKRKNLSEIIINSETDTNNKQRLEKSDINQHLIGDQETLKFSAM